MHQEEHMHKNEGPMQAHYGHIKEHLKHEHAEHAHHIEHAKKMHHMSKEHHKKEH